MKIGFIGLGIMGESMCANIVKKHNDTVYCSDHKQSKIDELSALGAIGCKTNTEVAKNADIIISMVPTSDDVRNLYDELMPYIDETKSALIWVLLTRLCRLRLQTRLRQRALSLRIAPL